MTIRIVLVEDHELVRAGLRLRLQRETNIELVGADNVVFELQSPKISPAQSARSRPGRCFVGRRRHSSVPPRGARVDDRDAGRRP